ncbi:MULTISPECIES: ABC transporter ATP-binding protein [Virgibacillus]|uniref:ABC transporter ATPase n=1 Tax=Virgibacillus pantothenticus TaxID=1473 RepID=A0A0L0QRW1_VIRPA|nr:MULTISPECIES: ABC transporter ATP-binding protein [Virgibacillus]API92096.1 ABC transporter ATP-binding protein [Virgibacillus sp. 6R]KNE21291.1 ABC transporter ATPase [Virgibacillus pantothenticus]MBS7430565.1 ABC transporter ATP-binding protein [Virgibacillus sp. 19R1-5]MBU8566504.1 ABC transporter ATP-binding protein [Virgibacillus pantothenticus]MBU8600081.1 ABC transporter ATP-binding protein [Virgibacillus pantothenticus]
MLAIETKGLTKQFGNLLAVNKVDLQIHKGHIYGFLGPNGSGKSTMIRMLCGVLKPTSGEGTVLTHDIKTEPEHIKQKIGYMSQKFSLYEELTMKENLDFYAGVYGLTGKESKARQEEIISLTGLSGRLNQRASSLSGGWKQRLALSCALLHKPELLVLDEPTAGVDPVSRRIFWEIITELAKAGITVLVTTHYMDEAELCTEIGFIFYGTILISGTPHKIKTEHNVHHLDDLFIKLVKEQQENSLHSGGLTYV